MRIFTKLLSMMVLLTSTFVFVGCGTAFTIDGNPTFQTTDEVYAFSAISAVSLLNQQYTTNSGMTPMSFMADEDEPIITTELDQLNRYLNIMEKFVGSSQSLAVELVTSDLPEYETKVNFTTKNILGEDVVYAIYYNEVFLDDSSEEDDEYETELFGLMTYNEIDYQLSGKREMEDDEESIRITASIDEFNYVNVKYELEEEERKFIFEEFINGELMNSTKVKVETEDDEIEVKLEFVAGEAKGKYKFEQEIKDEKTILKVSYEVVDELNNVESGEIEVYVVIDEVTGETVYKYEIQVEDDDSIYEYERDREEDDDDEDDDEDEDDEEDEEDEDEEEDEEEDSSNI